MWQFRATQNMTIKQWGYNSEFLTDCSLSLSYRASKRLLASSSFLLVCWENSQSSKLNSAVLRKILNTYSIIFHVIMIHSYLRLTGSLATAKHFWIRPSNVIFSTTCSSGMGFFKIFSAGMDCIGCGMRSCQRIQRWLINIHNNDNHISFF